MASVRRFCRKNIHYIIIALITLALATGACLIRGGSIRESAVINEICTSNVASCMDENGDYPDWIEIYNPTNHDIDLSGYMVNDSNNFLRELFVIPDGTVIAPGAFYLFDPHFPITSSGCVVSLLDEKRQYVDRIEVPGLKYDTTWARNIDGGDEWNIKSPTPGYSNSDGEIIPPISRLGRVAMSAEPGFYADDFDLRLSSPNYGWRIYYTVDGTDPKQNGLQYTEPIRIYDRSNDPNVYSMIKDVSLEYMDDLISPPSYPIDKCTVVRAVAMDDNGIYTEESINTYFVGFDQKSAYTGMSVVSAVVDPDDLFSKERGITVVGKKYDDFVAAGKPEDYSGPRANLTERGRGSERPVNIEIYNEDHVRVLKKDAGIRIKGMSSRWDLQKSFSIIFRRAYAGNYKESFNIEGDRLDLHSFALDKGGQDVGTKMKDTIMELCMSGTDCATTGRYPCCLFLNGEYWGFYWLAERYDNSFIADKYGVDKDQVLYKNTYDFESNEWDVGSFDRQSLLDCYAANTIIAHARNWPNYNFRAWKTMDEEGTKFGDGRYRPVIFDVNSASMEEYEYNNLEYLSEEFYPFMQMCSDDPDFATDLVARIDEMCDNEFKQEKIMGMIDELYSRIHDQMILDRRRYVDCTEEEAERYFDESVNVLKTFYMKRYDNLKVYEKEFLNGK